MPSSFGKRLCSAAKVLKPEILYPYHFGDTDTATLAVLLTDEKEIEIRIRNLK